MDNFKILTKLSEKPPTVIYKAKRNDTGGTVAIKKVTASCSSGIPQFTMREIALLKKLKSVYVVDLYEVFIKDNNVFLVLEYYPFSLRDLMSLKFNFTTEVFNSIAIQLFKAVGYIHKKGIVFRNLNPTNILLNSKSSLKLTGFSQSRYQNETMTNSCTSFHYQAPELLLGDTKYTNKIDSWSIGCILIEMKTGQVPFKGTDEISQCKLVFKTLGLSNCNYPWVDIYNFKHLSEVDNPRNVIQNKFGKFFEEKLFQIVKELFNVDKTKRISVLNALKLSVLKDAEITDCVIDILDAY